MDELSQERDTANAQVESLESMVKDLRSEVKALRVQWFDGV